MSIIKSQQEIINKMSEVKRIYNEERYNLCKKSYYVHLTNKTMIVVSNMILEKRNKHFVLGLKLKHFPFIKVTELIDLITNDSLPDHFEIYNNTITNHHAYILKHQTEEHTYLLRYTDKESEQYNYYGSNSLAITTTIFSKECILEILNTIIKVHGNNEIMTKW